MCQLNGHPNAPNPLQLWLYGLLRDSRRSVVAPKSFSLPESVLDKSKARFRRLQNSPSAQTLVIADLTLRQDFFPKRFQCQLKWIYLGQQIVVLNRCPNSRIRLTYFPLTRVFSSLKKIVKTFPMNKLQISEMDQVRILKLTTFEALLCFIQGIQEAMCVGFDDCCKRVARKW